jgi:hypothetical protein
MNYQNRLRLLFALSLLVNLVHAQKASSYKLNLHSTDPRSLSIAGSKIKYYKDSRNTFTRIQPPAVFLNRTNASGRLAAPTAQFIVTYTNFTAEARRAFQYAVDIWSTLIVSPVPIRIQANWVSQEPNVLGSAGPASYRYNFDGAQKATAFYPIALAEKIARRELNSPAEADIVADFNRNNDWYYGTDGKTPKGQTDLVTSVLHELAHGLGFIGFFYVKDDKGDQSDGVYLADLPSVYDHFIENGQPRNRLVTSQKEYPNNSIPLNRQLTGGDLYLNGSVLRQTTGQKLKLQAKAKFDRASSIYHLDEDKYPPGDPNSLMTAFLGQAESIHSPGPLLLTFFTDLEWKTTSLLHQPVLNSEDARNFVFSARIVSDTTLTAGSVRLFYRKTAPSAKDSAATGVSPTPIGNTNEYQYTLPAAQAQGDIWYYFQVQDASGRTFSSPSKLTNGAQTWHHVRTGPDSSPPIILYSPSKNSIFSTATTDSLPIYARIADDRSGIGAAYVEYQINGAAQPNLPLRYGRRTINGITYDSVYTNRITFPANSLKVGDKINYRIVARDSSRTKNQTINPANGFYELKAVAQQPVREQYITSFDNAATAADFVGNGFSITQPTGFNNPAIHSEHPYRNGTDFLFQNNAEYVLLAPIRIKANPDSAQIRYDEIVLVEPGDPGSRFGDANFYDYVVIEGSRDNGQTWKPLRDGYNSYDLSDWQNAYKSSLVPGQFGEQNSATIGIPALYRRREIPLLGSGSPFRAGEQILIRFRLFSDQLAHGWGWAIDNLRIQAPPPPPVLATEPVLTGTFRVYPNPVVQNIIRVEADLAKAVPEGQLSIMGTTGQILHQRTLKISGVRISEQVDTSQFSAGLYFLRLQIGEGVLTQKIVVVK